MFVCVANRKKHLHILDYIAAGNKYRTMCGQYIAKTERANTFAADNTFNGLCSECLDYYNQIYESTKAIFRIVKNTSYQRLLSNYAWAKKQHVQKNVFYIDKSWYKLNCYKVLINRKNKYYGK